MILADVIEHIEQDALENMFQKISNDLLVEDGILVGHTSPNKLHYEIHYEQKRRCAQRLGIYLPKNPRSVYEDLMHINEQTEEGLNNALSKYFEYVYTWIPLANDFFGTLRNNESFYNTIEKNDIYCIASNTPISLDEILCIFKQERIEELRKTNY